MFLCSIVLFGDCSICLVGLKSGANKNNERKGPLWRQRNIFGTRIKIMWDNQLVDSPIDYTITVTTVWNTGETGDINVPKE